MNSTHNLAIWITFASVCFRSVLKSHEKPDTDISIIRSWHILDTHFTYISVVRITATFSCIEILRGFVGSTRNL